MYVEGTTENEQVHKIRMKATLYEQTRILLYNLNYIY